MNIVHIAPNSVYNEGWSYQENLLTKYQVKLNNNVTLLVANQRFENGLVKKCDEYDYISPDGFRVVGIKYKNILGKRISDSCSLMNVYTLLEELEPDLIFFHGLISLTIFQASKYVRKHPTCKLVCDNHLDYNIGYKPHDSFKDLLVVFFYRIVFKLNKKWIEKVYGVTPWRKKYAEEVFRVPSSMTDVLIMGADDDNIAFQERKSIRERIRTSLKIEKDSFLIVTGGKIDRNKGIHLLMQAVKSLQGVKLVIFGLPLSSFEKEFNDAMNDNCIHIGWLQSKDVYEYYMAADLIAFPGQHSVLWEQACATKVPCFFKFYEGMDHVNNGGNSLIASFNSSEELKEIISGLVFTEAYYSMKKIAESDATDVYLYSNIAKKSIECVNSN